jgi:hypothetical protein
MIVWHFEEMMNRIAEKKQMSHEELLSRKAEAMFKAPPKKKKKKGKK